MGAEIENNRAHGTAGPGRIVLVTAAWAATRAAVKTPVAAGDPASGAILRATAVSPALGRAVLEAVLRGPAQALAEAADREAEGPGAAAAGVNCRIRGD